MKQLICFASLLVFAGCSGSDNDGATPPDAAVAIDAHVDLPCPANTVCLEPFLVTDKPGTPGRLAVVWFQPMHVQGLPSMPTEVAYDVPYVPGQSRYDIPLAQVKPPMSTAVVLCQWEMGVCQQMANPPPIAFALPVILDDTNGNGKIDGTEVTFYGNHGMGMAFFAWSLRAHPLGDPALFQYGSNTYLGNIFTAGIAAGVHGYAIQPGSSFEDKLAAADTASGSDLAICPSQGTSCQVNAPRLVGFENP
ncbi:MAG: hypothetical protein HOV81_18545 [Kofleriaceae bacterium]|nr:hypothetical protein [Kofleriaceae bacterium]